MHQLDQGWLGLSVDLQLVGSILHNPENIHKAAEAGVEDSYFSDDFALEIWKALSECVKDQLPISLVNVGLKLGLGKASQFANVVAYSPITTNFSYFLAEFLKKAAVNKARDVANLNKHLDPEGKARLVLETVQAITSKQREEKTISDVATNWADDLDRSWSGESNGVKIHIPALAEKLGDWQKGALYVLGARPGTGKTAFAVNGVSRCLYANERAIFATIEMPSEQIFSRFVCLRSRVPWVKLRDKEASSDEMDRVSTAVKQLSRSPLDILDDWQGRWDLLQPVLASKMREKIPPKLIVIDHLHIMKIGSKSPDNRVIELGEITGAIKRFALTWKVPIILLCQFNRNLEAENRMPRLSDLRGSGSIEQDADAVMLLHSGDYAHQLLVAKNRSGPVGRVQLEANLSIGEIKGSDFDGS